MSVTLWTYRRFILTSALADLKHRFSGSVAGYLWNVFVPLAQLTVFALIFSVLMGNQIDEGPKGRFSFIIFLCSGLLAWNAFAETLVRSSAALVSNAGYLKKLPIPEQIFVAQEATGGFVTALISISLFAIFSMTVAGYGPKWEWIQAIPLLFLFVALAYGLGLMMACFNVFFRDVNPFMNVLVLLWMWLTPVVYVEKIFHDPSHPHPYVLMLLKFNPAYHYISGFHQSLWLGQWLAIETWIICLCVTLAANMLGAAVLRSCRAELRDVL